MKGNDLSELDLKLIRREHPPKGFIHEFLQLIAKTTQSDTTSRWPYSSVADFLLRHGRLYQPATLPSGLRYGTAKACFYNSATAANRLAAAGYVYVEGYAAGIIPVHHAWLTHRDHPEDAYEITWGSKVPRLEYFGVPLQIGYVLKTAEICGSWSVFDRRDYEFPLLTGEHAVTEALDVL